jgi:hypothetical protein
MTEDYWFVTPAFLIGLVILYFLNERIVRKSRGQNLTRLSVRTLDRRYGKYVDLRPGRHVPQSGNYECILCAKGGWQDAINTLLLGKAEASRRTKSWKATQQFFNQNSVFPPCPNCGNEGGWSLLNE